MNKAAKPRTVAKPQKSGLEARDFINTGLYFLLYALTAFVGGSIGYVPVLYPLAPLSIGLLGGIVFVLFVSKVKSFGQITAVGLLAGLGLAATGHGLYVIIVAAVLAPLSDWLCGRRGYRSFKWITIGYAVFCQIFMGTYLPMFLAADTYYAYIAEMISPTYANQVREVMQGWVFPLVFVGAAVGGVLGAFLGRAIFRRHFKRAGVAR